MKHLQTKTINEVIGLANRCYPPDEQHHKRENPSEIEKLEDFIDKLNDDEKAELMALMWLGRDRDVDQWDDLLSHAKNEIDDAAIYIAEKMSLATYLKRGLEKLA
jgi:P2-related tail formation protein